MVVPRTMLLAFRFSFELHTHQPQFETVSGKVQKEAIWKFKTTSCSESYPKPRMRILPPCSVSVVSAPPARDPSRTLRIYRLAMSWYLCTSRASCNRFVLCHNAISIWSHRTWTMLLHPERKNEWSAMYPGKERGHIPLIFTILF